MRTATDLMNKSKQPLEIEEDSVNYLTKKQLEDYLAIAANFLSQEAKDIINWLIVNNATYIKDLSTGDTDNALVDFYNKGIPTDEHLKELYKWVGTLVKKGRIAEVPVFQTKQQFDAIMKKECTLDDVVLDLITPGGRNAVAKKYDKLVHKIVNDFIGKSSLNEDDLYASGLEGLAGAINCYGKPSKTQQLEMDERIEKARKDAEAAGEDPNEAEQKIKDEYKEADDKKKLTFLQFAGWRIRQAILGAIENESHSVRIPKSQQQRIRKEQGQIAKSYDVSGDEKIGKDEDGSRTVWDVIGDTQPVNTGIDKEETILAKKKLLDAIHKKVGDRNFEWIENALKDDDDETKMDVKDLAKKWKVSDSSISTVASKKAIQKLVMGDPELKRLAYDWYQKFEESLHEELENTIDPTRPVSLKYRKF